MSASSLPKPSARQLFMDYHTRAITQARVALAKTNDPNTIAMLNHVIDRHTAAVNQLDREAQSKDRRSA